MASIRSALVEHENPYVREVDKLALGEILQASRRGDQDVRALCALRLGVERHTAVDGGHLEAFGRYQ